MAADVTRYRIKGRTFAEDDPALQDELAKVHDTPERPLCMCIPGGVEMYVAKYAKYVIKRMPDDGREHHPSCQHYELAVTESGLGELFGEAIIAHDPETTELRVDFPLTRTVGRAIVRSGATEPGEVSAERRRMSLRAVMHFLWDRAQFNRWYPRMEGKRNWGLLRHFLMREATRLEVKGGKLSEVLYLPEPFSAKDKAAIAERRAERLRPLRSPDADVQLRMMLLLGELILDDETGKGGRLFIKHLPDCPLLIDERAWGKVLKVYRPIIETQQTNPELKIVFSAVIYAKSEAAYQIDRAALMLTTENWIPVEGPHDIELLRRLTSAKRSFVKPLRYDAIAPAAFANAKLLDAGPKEVPLDVVGALWPEKKGKRSKSTRRSAAAPGSGQRTSRCRTSRRSHARRPLRRPFSNNRKRPPA